MKNELRYVAGELRTGGPAEDFMIYARAVKYGALSLPGVPLPGTREKIAAGPLRNRSPAGAMCSLFSTTT